MARRVPTVIGSRQAVVEHLKALDMYEPVKRLSAVLNTQFRGIRVEQTLADGTSKVTEYEVIATAWIDDPPS